MSLGTRFPTVAMPRLIHWNKDEAKQKAARLNSADYEVVHEPIDPAAASRDLRESPPSAVVIDLSRLPTQGRDMGLPIRPHKLALAQESLAAGVGSDSGCRTQGGIGGRAPRQGVRGQCCMVGPAFHPPAMARELARSTFHGNFT